MVNAPYYCVMKRSSSGADRILLSILIWNYSVQRLSLSHAGSLRGHPILHSRITMEDSAMRTTKGKGASMKNTVMGTFIPVARCTPPTGRDHPPIPTLACDRIGGRSVPARQRE